MAVTTVQVAKKTSRVVLFDATLPAPALKDIAKSAKPIADMLVLQVASHAEDDHLRWWAVDENGVVAMDGRVKDVLFVACDGDGETHTVQVPVKVLLPVLSGFDTLASGELRLKIVVEGGTHYLLLSQSSKEEGVPPSTRCIDIVPSAIEPEKPDLADVAYATVDVQRLKKVLGSMKKNTDVLSVKVGDGAVTVTAKTKRIDDVWSAPSSTDGHAEELFSTPHLHAVFDGAACIERFGEIRLADGGPLHLSASSEEMEVSFYIAARETMR